MSVTDILLLLRPCPYCDHPISAWRTFKPENFRKTECPNCHRSFRVKRGLRIIAILMLVTGIPIYTNDAVPDGIKAIIFAIQLTIALASELWTRFEKDRPARAEE